jgi:hypothetical protein
MQVMLMDVCDGCLHTFIQRERERERERRRAGKSARAMNRACCRRIHGDGAVAIAIAIAIAARAPRRFLSSLHSGPDSLEELLEKHVVSDQSKRSASNGDDDEERARRRRLTSSRREALSLYRDILRASRFFLWPDERGVLWRDVLRASSRKEFEDARYEQDPEIIARLLVGGRDALEQAVEKAIKKQSAQLPKYPSPDPSSSSSDPDR